MPEGRSFPRGPKAIILGHGPWNQGGGSSCVSGVMARSVCFPCGRADTDSSAVVSPSSARLGYPGSGSGGERDLRPARLPGSDVALHQ
jgi:hypothetical protein